MKNFYLYLLLLLALFLTNINLLSQTVFIKDGEITSSDTINRVDKNGLKQGTWVISSNDES